MEDVRACPEKKLSDVGEKGVSWGIMLGPPTSLYTTSDIPLLQLSYEVGNDNTTLAGALSSSKIVENMQFRLDLITPLAFSMH